MSITSKKSKKSKSKKKSNLKTVSFDEEIVTKKQAKEILENPDLINKNLQKKDQLEVVNNREGVVPSENTTSNLSSKTKKKKVKKETSSNSIESETSKQVDDIPGQINVPPKSKKRKNVTKEVETTNEIENDTEKDVESNDPKPLSIRAQKRMKHAKLIEDKKLKSDLAIQEKTLNYLSKWKHNRSEWKFEKLKQIWLQQNLYDSAKVPNEFWKTVVDYMESATGHVRQILCKEALKIIENEDEQANDNDEYKIRVGRARDIIQYLQE